MPQAGDTIRALDFPPSVEASTGNNEEDLSSTTYETGTTVVETTFVVGTSGKIEVAWRVRGRGDGTNALLVSYQVYEGVSAGGMLVVDTSDDRAVQLVIADTETGGLTATHGGLTVGATHYIRLMHKVLGGTTSDIFHRAVSVAPAT